MTASRWTVRDSRSPGCMTRANRRSPSTVNEIQHGPVGCSSSFSGCRAGTALEAGVDAGDAPFVPVSPFGTGVEAAPVAGGTAPDEGRGADGAGTARSGDGAGSGVAA